MNHITRYTSPNYDYGNDPKYIVIHHWGGDGQSFSGVLGWLCNSRSGVSAHYVVSGNDAACIVDWNRAAWHAGNYWYNHHSIGIECRPEMDNTTYNTVIELVAYIYKQLGKVLPVIGHKDIVATACPGRYYPYLSDIQAKATAMYKGVDMGWKQDGKGWWYKTKDGYYKNCWQKINGSWYYFKDDGYICQSCWKQINGKWYHFNLGGQMMTGWIKPENTWYYLGSDGAMLTGLQKIENTTYYLNPDGSMAIGWKEISGKKQYFKPDGSRLEKGVISEGDNYYVIKDGCTLSNATLKVAADGKLII